MWYKIRRAQVIDREGWVVQFCTNKSVLHVGAAQARDKNPLDLLSGQNKTDLWLHSHISAVTTHCIGLDYNKEAVDFLRNAMNINNIFYADATSNASLNEALGDQRFDVIVLGEILEHLTCGGIALRALMKYLNTGGTFLITVPNLLSLRYLLSPLFAREGHDEDHVIGFTPRLIEAYLEKEGLGVSQFLYYYERRSKTSTMSYSIRNSVNKAITSVYPWLSEGMVVTAAKHEEYKSTI